MTDERMREILAELHGRLWFDNMLHLDKPGLYEPSKVLIMGAVTREQLEAIARYMVPPR